MKPSVRIVTHIYAVDLPQYGVFLRAQLSSLIIHKSSKVDTYVTVCCTESDERSMEVLDEFQELLGDRLFIYKMTPERLFRRSIGRNAEALSCVEDLIWFADADYVFGSNCFNTLLKGYHNVQHLNPTMLWPKYVQKQLNHADGDVFWQKNIDTKGLLDIKENSFFQFRYRRPIGGVQIIPKAIANKHGYLNEGHDKWQKPAGHYGFGCFRDDPKATSFAGKIGEVLSVPVDNVFRLRHTKTSYQ